jgi:hypothetical protein
MSPYISIIFANRNDGYTKDQEARIRAFIDFYAYYDRIYPDLFEFIICDWNPPEERPSLENQFAWDKLSRVIHLVVPREVHLKLCPDNSRPILDYTARNTCIRKASAPFILVINQDIFLSASILKFLSQRSLSEKYFYRADRCDFAFNYEEGFTAWDRFDQYAKKNALKKHIRPSSPKKEMSLPVDEKTYASVFTRRKFFEYKVGNIVYSDFYALAKHLFRLGRRSTPLYKRFFLHTNASGDFLLASRRAFYDVHGFVETHQFYMHLDSYMCMQLFAAGYKQAILALPYVVFHSDHSRSAREGRPESMTYNEHVKIWGEICMGNRSCKINPDSWGLKNLIS